MNLLDQLPVAEHWLKEGNSTSAKALLIKILDTHPSHGGAIRLLAHAYAHNCEYLQASKLLLKLVNTDGASALDHAMLGELLLELGNYQQAIHHYKIALHSMVPNFEILHNIGLAYAQLFQFKEAVEHFAKAALIHPDSFELQLNWGAALKNLGELEDSLQHLMEAEKTSPSDPRVWLNKGVTFEAMGKQDQALTCYETAIKHKPDYIEAHCNKANSLLVLRRHDQALSSFKNALTLKPDDADTLYNLSLLQLAQGDYRNGWKNYEQRWHRENAPKGLFNQYAPLKNLVNIREKHIIVWSEQGLGDSIQFCRYIPKLTELGARITIATHTQLIELFKSLKGIDDVININQKTFPAYDFQISLLSLPLLFEDASLPLPCSIPYLEPNPIKSLAWAKRLQDEKKLKVGLVWSGGHRPDQPELWAVNSRRNIPLDSIAKLQEVQGVQFFSLQKGYPAEDELEGLKQQIWPKDNLSIVASELDSFEDTAALIKNLDLLISVDTSTAHLAGALGKPLWLLNRYDSCWRWLIEQEKTIWYPSAKIFNQPALGDWDSVISTVTQELSLMASTRTQ
jgi:tetratricopeptide (TPR) repeat protein